MRRYIGSFKAAGTHKNESFAQQSLPISTSLPEEGNAQRRFVSIKAVSPTTPVLCLVTQPFQSGDRCPTTDLGQSIPLYINSFIHFLHFAFFYKPWRKSGTTKQKKVACHTNSAVSNLVHPYTRNVYSLSTATSKEHKFKNSTRGNSSSKWKQNITTSNVDQIRERLLKEVWYNKKLSMKFL